MTEDRRIAIICWNKDTTWSKKIIEHLYGQHVVFYYKPGVEEFTPPNCDAAFFPEEIDTPAIIPHVAPRFHPSNNTIKTQRIPLIDKPNIENSPILLNATAQRIPDAIKVSCESIFLFLKSKITGKPSVKIK